MKVHFKYNRILDGKLYSVGSHELEDQLANHWYIKALAKDGDITIEGVKAEDKPAPVKEEKPASQPQKKKG